MSISFKALRALTFAPVFLSILSLSAFAATASINLEGSIALPGKPHDIAVSGYYAYVADSDNGIRIFDVSDPAHPTLVKVYSTGGTPYGLKIVGNLVYVANGRNGLEIFNIVSPTNPFHVGSISVSDFAWDVAVSGDRAYIANDQDGLLVIDISNPSSPRKVTLISTPVTGRMRIFEKRVYVTHQSYGMSIFDISDPNLPKLIGFYDSPGWVNDIAVNGHLAYLADGNRLRTIDIKDPTKTVEIKEEEILAGICLFDNNYIYSVALNQLSIFDVANPREPALVAQYNALNSGVTVAAGNSGASITIANGKIYVIDNSGFSVLKATLPPRNKNLTWISSTPTCNSAQAVLVSDQYAYVADMYAGLQIFNVSDPVNPKLTGSYDTTNRARGLDKAGPLVYVANGYDGVEIINVSNPANPIRIGHIAVTSYVWDVAVSGDYAYIANYDDNRDSGFSIANIADPTQPKMLGSLFTPYACKVKVVGNTVFLAHGGYGMSIIDVENPAHPVLKSFFKSPGWVNALATFGNTVYIADGTAMRVLDAHYPVAPIELGSVYAFGTGIDYANFKVFTTSGSGIHIFDVLDPSAPELIGLTEGSLEQARDIAYVEPFAYVADEQKGLVIFKHTESNGSNPPVQVLSPNGGERLLGDSLIKIHWKTNVTLAGTGVKLELWDSQKRLLDLGYGWDLAGENTSEVYLPLMPNRPDYRIRAISTSNPEFYDESDQPVVIMGGAVQIHQPNGGEVWKLGTQQWIWWQTSTYTAGTGVRLELWCKDKKVVNLGNDWAANGENICKIQVPDVTPCAEYKVRAVSTWNPTLYDESDNIFMIQGDHNAVDEANWAIYQ